MGHWQVWVIGCDKCKRTEFEATTATSLDEAWAAAQETGWVHIDEIGHTCPSCAVDVGVEWKCPACGSTNIDGKVWVNLNTSELGEAASDEAYCNDCGFEGRPDQIRRAETCESSER